MTAKRFLLGKVGVDSGLLMIGDPCYHIHQRPRPKAFGKIWLDFCNNLAKAEETDLAWKVPFDLGHEGLAVITQTHHGDGVYPVFGEFKDGETTPCKIIINLR